MQPEEGGFLVEEDQKLTTTTTTRQRQRAYYEEQKEIDRLDTMTTQILRKFRKRSEPSGYGSLPELWQDLSVVIEASLNLSPPQAIQRLLSLSSQFYDYCLAYKNDTETSEFQEYFQFLDNAWVAVLQKQHSMTDVIRALNVLRDGHQLAADELHVPNALNRALQTGLPQSLGGQEP